MMGKALDWYGEKIEYIFQKVKEAVRLQGKEPIGFGLHLAVFENGKTLQQEIRAIFKEIYEKGQESGKRLFVEEHQQKLEEYMSKNEKNNSVGFLSDEEIEELKNFPIHIDGNLSEKLILLKAKNDSAILKTSTTQQQIEALFDNFKEFLKEKNKRYGDSAINPMQIFSKTNQGTQICNRLDDKLSRIKNSSELKKNDLSDVFGYVALLLIQNGWTDFDELLD